MQPVIQMKNIVKEFPGVVANNHIDFDLRRGEIHALLGENGSGKTTLMNILYGMYRPDKGEIFVDGQKASIRSPSDAIKRGIGMVHQHFMLIPAHTVVENTILGFKASRGPLVDTSIAADRIEDLSRRYSIKVDPKAFIWQLSVGEQQRVEILKALYRGAHILILDEPTSVLTPQETNELFKALRNVANQGSSIIFISHKLEEVMSISDRVTILRNGRLISTVDTREVTKEKLAEMMVGRTILLRLQKEAIAQGDEVPTVLTVENLWVKNDKGLPAVKGINLGLRKGEILGIAGVDGNGQRELAEAIVGLRKVHKGNVLIKNQDVTNSDPIRIYDLNVAYIPDERLEYGVVQDFDFQRNILLKLYRDTDMRKGPVINFKKIKEFCAKLASDYDVKIGDMRSPVRQLSGGNIQKVILARELCSLPDLIIASQPTTGLDVGATESICSILLNHRSRGAAILLISTTLEEIISLSDRICVIYEGQIMGTIDAKDAKINELGLMMGGVRK